MKKLSIAAVSTLLIAALAVPSAALAKGGNQNRGTSDSAIGQGKGRPTDISAPDGGLTAKEARKAERSAARLARKAQKAEAKQAREDEKAAAKQARTAGGAVGAADMGSEESSESVESSAPTGPGIANAMSRITANLEKSLAKIASGKKKQLPPGLVRVWLKFAAWLGIDPTTQPGYVAPETTSTPEPTTTVEPTPTIDPTPTVEPTPTVVPTTTVDPGASPTAP